MKTVGIGCVIVRWHFLSGSMPAAGRVLPPVQRWSWILERPCSAGSERPRFLKPRQNSHPGADHSSAASLDADADGLRSFTCAPDGIHAFGKQQLDFRARHFPEPLAMRRNAAEPRTCLQPAMPFRLRRHDTAISSHVRSKPDADGWTAAFRRKRHANSVTADFARLAPHAGSAAQRGFWEASFLVVLPRRPNAVLPASASTFRVTGR
ncbi:MAG: hypothetical protein H6889_13250 [Brucellaceae bacterium]|nr:hypothetical protein [Brucellaceae bacterium]